MYVDLDQKFIFPPEIMSTTLRPDLVLWSTSHESLCIVELTVPLEAAADEAYERRKVEIHTHNTQVVPLGTKQQQQ